MFYVYKITNLVNGKVYIGKTNNVMSRYNHHMTRPFHHAGANACVKFYNSIRKYGVENFSQPEVLGEYENEEAAYDAEEDFIRKYDSVVNGLNTIYGGLHAMSGADHPKYGKPMLPHVKDALLMGLERAREAGIPVGMSGKHHSNETRQVLSEKTTAFFQKHPHPLLGTHHTDEARKQMSESKRALFASGYQNSNTGQPMSEEQKLLISATKKKNGLSLGSNNPSATIDEAVVIIIKKLLMHGHTIKEISVMIGVSYDIVKNIRSGKSWSHVLV